MGCCLVLGCATNTVKEVEDAETGVRKALHRAIEEVSQVKFPPSDSASHASADKTFREVVRACARVLNHLEKRGDRRRTRLLTAAIVGSVAGSVAAPAVIAHEGSMALSAGFSGISGATNTLQQMLGEQGYTRAELIFARQHIVGALNAHVEAWLKPGITVPEKIALVNAMVLSCTVYPLNAEQPSPAVEAMVGDNDAEIGGSGDGRDVIGEPAG